jgi:hypothetical protein
LFSSPNNQFLAETYSDGRPGSRSFAFHGVPDGEYYLLARRHAYQDNNGASGPKIAAKVKGSDVTGLELVLRATGSISGSVQLQALTEDERKSKCESKRTALVEESLILARSDDRAKKTTALSSFDELLGAPNNKGDFKIADVEPGPYRLELRPPGDQWYVRTITLPPIAKGKPPIDAARDGLAMSTGQQVTGVTLTLVEGAAKLRGRVIPEKVGADLPTNLRIYLVPAEKESANDVLRFFEVSAHAEGVFELAYIQPGRYWMLALALPYLPKLASRTNVQ